MWGNFLVTGTTKTCLDSGFAENELEEMCLQVGMHKISITGPLALQSPKSSNAGTDGCN